MSRRFLLQTLKWLIVLSTSVAMLAVAVHGKHCLRLSLCILIGGALGFFYGLLAQLSAAEHARRQMIMLKNNLDWTEVHKQTCDACVVGMYLGMAEALIQLLN